MVDKQRMISLWSQSARMQTFARFFAVTERTQLLGRLIVDSCCCLFVFVVSGIYFWDERDHLVPHVNKQKRKVTVADRGIFTSCPRRNGYATNSFKLSLFNVNKLSSVTQTGGFLKR